MRVAWDITVEEENCLSDHKIEEKWDQEFITGREEKFLGLGGPS
jgi:hypothetical protein